MVEMAGTMAGKEPWERATLLLSYRHRGGFTWGFLPFEDQNKAGEKEGTTCAPPPPGLNIRLNHLLFSSLPSFLPSSIFLLFSLHFSSK
jgi:hypothetical protein